MADEQPPKPGGFSFEEEDGEWVSSKIKGFTFEDDDEVTNIQLTKY